MIRVTLTIDGQLPPPPTPPDGYEADGYEAEFEGKDEDGSAGKTVGEALAVMAGDLDGRFRVYAECVRREDGREVEWMHCYYHPVKGWRAWTRV